MVARRGRVSVTVPEVQMQPCCSMPESGSSFCWLQVILGGGADDVLEGPVVMLLVGPPLEADVMETVPVAPIPKSMAGRDTDMVLIDAGVGL